MKMRKILLTVFSALLIVCLSVGATVAYLTSTDEVKNTFTVGDVRINLQETVVDEYGVATSTNLGTTEGNNYKLMPGHTYTKDPIVFVNPGSENAWLFVKVENGIADIEAADVDEENPTTIAGQMTKDNTWTLVSGTTNVYAYKYIGTDGTQALVFSSFTIADNADISEYADAKIVITAYAVQAAGFATAEDAWNATFGAKTN